MARRKTSRGRALRPNIDASLKRRFQDLLKGCNRLLATPEQNDACVAAVSLLAAKISMINQRLASLERYYYGIGFMTLGQWTGDRTGGINQESLTKIARDLSDVLFKAEADQAARDEVIYRASGESREVVRFQRINPQVGKTVVLILQKAFFRHLTDRISEMMEAVGDMIDDAHSAVRRLLMPGDPSGHAEVIGRSDDPDASPILLLSYDDSKAGSPEQVYNVLAANLQEAERVHAALLKLVAKVIGESVIRANRLSGSARK